MQLNVDGGNGPSAVLEMWVILVCRKSKFQLALHVALSSRAPWKEAGEMPLVHANLDP